MNDRKPLSKKQLAQLVKEFNAAFPAGTPVLLRKDRGTTVTVVKAPAEILAGHSAVAWFEGVSGAYSIEGGRVSRSPLS